GIRTQTATSGLHVPDDAIGQAAPLGDATGFAWPNGSCTAGANLHPTSADVCSSPAPHVAAKDAAFQAQVAALTDPLLLSIRDGAWCKVAALALWLAPRLAADWAVHRYLSAGGLVDKKFDHQCAEGQKRVLQDILETLRAQQLITFRTTEEGEEE